MNTSNNNNIIVTSNLPYIKVQNESPFNTLINFQKVTNTESSVSINVEIMDENKISDEISSHHDSAEILYHTYDDNGINLFNTY